jgi:hypothetical protein
MKRHPRVRRHIHRHMHFHMHHWRDHVPREYHRYLPPPRARADGPC